MDPFCYHDTSKIYNVLILNSIYLVHKAFQQAHILHEPLNKPKETFSTIYWLDTLLLKK